MPAVCLYLIDVWNPGERYRVSYRCVCDSLRWSSDSTQTGADTEGGGFVFCWDRKEVDFLCFRPAGQTHGMPASSGLGIVETNGVDLA